MQATLLGAAINDTGEMISACASFCNNDTADLGSLLLDGNKTTSKYCSGIGCCQVIIASDTAPSGLQYKRVVAETNS